jgi:type I restriction-modification system DNA methylase subunit
LDECFADARNLFATSKWLNETFNGNFLPLSQDGILDYFKQLDRHVFDELNAIAKGYESSSNGIYQYRLFNIYDFAHIPVGLLSQVYEKFASKHDPTAKATSVHYTPRNIAATLVEEVFDGLQDAHNARVLDPSCGAGVFLVLAFHKLYEERWKKEGKRPKTQAIRNILERQLTGLILAILH